MDLQSFLELCNGTWFSQRTRYLLAEEISESHKSELAISFLTPDDSNLVQLCQQRPSVPQRCLGGWQVSWSSASDWGSPKQTGTATVAFIAEEGDGSSGLLLRSANQVGKPTLLGHYVLDRDDALTLKLGEGALEAEERIWFASENLRLRTSLMRQGDRYEQTAFYSEIRKIQAPTAKA